MFRKYNSGVCEDFKLGTAFEKFPHCVIILFSEHVSSRSFQNGLAEPLKNLSSVSGKFLHNPRSPGKLLYIQGTQVWNGSFCTHLRCLSGANQL